MEKQSRRAEQKFLGRSRAASAASAAMMALSAAHAAATASARSAAATSAAERSWASQFLMASMFSVELT